ncbi:small, acid-soluble spore protein, alpha/beta type [Bacillus sp. DJP31]|uniref:small, acid-soluble spore protein, alpha/beta type n=1 Tax=Bacillus sp. DJP31 TaxID=3409789 RepID=UPI003BB612EF
MSRGRKTLVPEARDGLNKLKVKVMNENGFSIHEHNQAKIEMAKEEGITLKEGYNEQLTSREAGRVGGAIGGKMVSELVEMAKSQLK